MPTAAAPTTAVAMISARPVSVLGLKWWRRCPARPGCRTTSVTIVSLETCGLWVDGQREARSATTPPTTTPAPTVNRNTIGTLVTQLGARVCLGS